jgi:hypothetical protein
MPPEAIIPNRENSVMVGRAAFGTTIRRLGDMKVSLFWLLFCLICLLVIAVTVGGVVDGPIAAGKRYYMDIMTQSLNPK